MPTFLCGALKTAPYRLFEYIVVNKDIKKEELKELIIEMKGEDTMPTLAQRWLDEGKAEGIQIGMQQGMQQRFFLTGLDNGGHYTARSRKAEFPLLMGTSTKLSWSSSLAIPMSKPVAMIREESFDFNA